MTARRTRLLPVAALIALALGGCGLPGSLQPGVTYSGDATHYRVAEGWLGNCSYPEYGPGRETLYAAINAADYENARACGGQVLVRRGDRSVSVTIVDQCPECPRGDIDLSPAAFAAIGALPEGRVPVTWQLVAKPAPVVRYRVKEGSSPWWLALQPVDQRWPVQRLEVQRGDTWQELARTSYNYFVAPSGLGPGPFTVRLTAITGAQLVHPGIELRPGALQASASQFG